MKKASNILTIIALIIIIVLIGTVCYGYYKNATMEVKNPIVTMEVQDFGTIKLELYPDMAPEAVTNFIALAQNGFYNGLKFHRVVEGFMIQGGDSNGDEEYCITGEFLANGYNNNKLKHKEGIISMARSDYTKQYGDSLATESYNSADSQFFIMTADNESLDGYYASFGKVIEGMDVVHNIEKVEVKVPDTDESTETTDSEEEQEKSTPVNDIIITKVTVETYGIDYGKPNTLKPWDYYDWVYQTYGIDLRGYGTN